ncbi:myxosortase-dependent metalloprotease, MXAN_2677/MXAN_2678 family [Myxococcus sp. AS-1-15]|uniref:myxosortase-dependent metalloprotease, MXAN_2677/MXAN_2678 family n=1 Tax=Myxococcus sp. AS-1-15 TaxID=2874600 RepID=UPI001CBFA5F9|nr:matrixin family metalloprotease [Myxococcus sp. AS-1-15]
MRRPLVLALTLVASAPAVAQDTYPYRRTTANGNGRMCLVWPAPEYVYHLDAAGSARTPGDTEVAAIEASFESWRRVAATCSDYTFRRGRDWEGKVEVGYVKEDPASNYNIITFRETYCFDVAPEDDACWTEMTCGNKYACWDEDSRTLAITISSHGVESGRVWDADIEVNAAGYLFTTVDAPPCVEGSESVDCVAMDLQNTMTHEIGHVVGLDHVPYPGATMERTAPLGETQKRIIDAGSAEGFCSIYPKGLPPNQCIMKNTGLALLGDGRGTGCASAPGAVVAGGWLAALALLRARRRRG